MINKIRIIPRKEDNRLLEGDLFIVEDLWCISAADVSVRGGGLKAQIKVTCKEVQPSVFLPVSTTMSSFIDIMGFKAEASYLAAVHYTEVKTDIQPQETKKKKRRRLQRTVQRNQKNINMNDLPALAVKILRLIHLPISGIPFTGLPCVACRCDWKKCRVINTKKRLF